MLIKLKPEDFVVRELADFSPRPKGPVSVYELWKRKLSTFDAVRRLAARAKIPLDRISYLGLKDRQAVTTQLISVERGRIPSGIRIPGIKIRYLGRAREPLSTENLRGNAFTIVVRDLDPARVRAFRERLAHVQSQGLINYFDDQRFGTIVAGQGMPGRDLVRGDFESAVRRMFATPGHRDPLPDKRFKHLIQKAWGDWDLIATKWGNRKGASVARHLRRKPGDFAGALQRMPAKERAIHVFAYQSLVWNRAVGLYLEGRFPAKQRSATPYSAGEHVWLDQPAELPEAFPLLDHEVVIEDPDIKAAIDAALAEEELTQERFEIDGIPGCFFKHHQRRLRVRPEDLRLLNAPADDDRYPGKKRLALSFSLPPGAYATLVLKRLFGGELERADWSPQERSRGKRSTKKANRERKRRRKRRRNKKSE